MLPCCMALTPMMTLIMTGLLVGVCLNIGATVIKNRRQNCEPAGYDETRYQPRNSRGACCAETRRSKGAGTRKSPARDECGSGYAYLRARQTKMNEPRCQIKRNKFGCEIDYWGRKRDMDWWGWTKTLQKRMWSLENWYFHWKGYYKGRPLEIWFDTSSENLMEIKYKTIIVINDRWKKIQLMIQAKM